MNASAKVNNADRVVVGICKPKELTFIQAKHKETDAASEAVNAQDIAMCLRA